MFGGGTSGSVGSSGSSETSTMITSCPLRHQQTLAPARLDLARGGLRVLGVDRAVEVLHHRAARRALGEPALTLAGGGPGAYAVGDVLQPVLLAVDALDERIRCRRERRQQVDGLRCRALLEDLVEDVAVHAAAYCVLVEAAELVSLVRRPAQLRQQPLSGVGRALAAEHCALLGDRIGDRLSLLEEFGLHVLPALGSLRQLLALTLDGLLLLGRVLACQLRAFALTLELAPDAVQLLAGDRKSTRLNSSHVAITYADTSM